MHETVVEVDPEEAGGEADVLLELLLEVLLDDGLEFGALGLVE